MNINGSINFITSGTAKTYEHLESGFSFRSVGDGAFEPAVTDKFALSDNIVESLTDRRLRQFVAAEGAFTKPENAVASEEVGKEKLQQLAGDMLGKGWTADAFYTAGGGVAGRTVVKFTSATGAVQTVDIEHYGKEYKVQLGAKVSKDGWDIKQAVEAPVQDGRILADQVVESAYLTKY